MLNPDNPFDAIDNLAKQVSNDLVNDLKKRCEALKLWHDEAEQDLKEKYTQIDSREQTVVDERRNLAQSLLKLRLRKRKLKVDLQALADERKILLKQKAQFVQSNNDLDEERADLRRLRKQLNKEWEHIRAIRKAQDDLASALEHDRKRISDMQLMLVSVKDLLTDTDESDDVPPLTFKAS